MLLKPTAPPGLGRQVIYLLVINISHQRGRISAASSPSYSTDIWGLFTTYLAPHQEPALQPAQVLGGSKAEALLSHGTMLQGNLCSARCPSPLDFCF